jgi:WD40 repeat protein
MRFGRGLPRAAFTIALAIGGGVVVSRGGGPGAEPDLDAAVSGEAELVIGRRNAPPLEQTYCVAFGPGGQWFADGLRDGTVRVWDRGSRAVRCRWTGHAGVVTALAFAPDRPELLSTGRDRKVRLWSLAGDVPVLRAEVSCADWPGAAAFAPDGSTVAVGTGDTVRLWRVQADRLVPAGERSTGGQAVQALAFAPAGAGLAAGGTGDNAVRLWRLDEAGEPTVLAGSDDFQVRGLGFVRAGRTLVTVHVTGAVVARDLPDGERREGLLDGPACRQVVLAPDGRHALVAHYDGTARLLPLPRALAAED